LPFFVSLHKNKNMSNIQLPYTIPARLNNSFSLFSNNDFLGFVDEKQMNYAEVQSQVENIRRLLQKAGIAKGDKVALLSGNMPNWGIVYFAVASSGAVIVPILPDFSSDETANIIEHSESTALFVSDLQMPKIENRTFENLKFIVKINDFEVIHSKVDISEYSQIQLDDAQVTEEDLAAIIYTSGTTGNSKGVMLTHKNLMSNVESAGILQPIFPNDRFLSILPMSHTYENTLGFLLPMMHGASVFYLKKPPTPNILMAAMASVKPTLMLSVPLIIEKIYRNRVLSTIKAKAITRTLYNVSFFRKLINKAAGKKLMKTFGGELRFFGIGGAKLDAVVEQFLLEAKFPYAIGYGLTETSPILAGVNPQMVRLQTTGPAVRGVELKLHNVNSETGEGEIWAKGPNVMKGYYKNPEATAEVLTEDGWFKTGDLATFDKDGFVYIRGRSKNVIIGANGKNIYPEEIESLINNYDYVVESLVVEQKGRLVAYVHYNMEELTKNFNSMKTEVNNFLDEKVTELSKEIMEYVNSKVGSFATIKMVISHAEPFEKTPTQKIKRYKYIS